LPSRLLLWQTPSDHSPTQQVQDNDVLDAIVSAALISQIFMAMSLVSMLKYQQETLLFVSVL
jgi:hypothetical protein